MKTYQCSKSALSLGLIIALISPSLALSPVSPMSPVMTRIGVAGGVRGTVHAFSSAEAPVGRILASGQPLYLNEKIVTGPGGSLQVMLLDETVFTIGPNSMMILDEFVYDPSSHSGKVAARVLKGIFRFVTGQIGHRKPSDMMVKFPIGIMGIRGTIVAGQVTETGTTAVLLGPGSAMNAPGERVGAFRLENAGTRVDVVKPGYGTHIDSPNAPPSAPALVPQAQLTAILEAISAVPQAKAPSGSQGAVTAPAESKSDQQNSATPAPAPALSESGDGQRASASDASGQSTAGAGGDLSNTQDVSDLTTDLSDATQTASFDIDNDFEAFLAANQSSWDDVRSITSGSGQYAGTDSFYLYQCEGGACADSNGPHGTVDFLMNIDFGKQTIGGNAGGTLTNSHLTVTANDPALAHGAVNDTVAFNSTSFSALTGPAGVTGASASGNLNANVSILNIGGTAGMAAGVGVYVDARGTIGAGGVIASRADCAVAGACK